MTLSLLSYHICAKQREVSDRSFIFCEASGLCSLHDSKIAIISFSSSENAFTGGNLSIDAVIDHYLDGNATNFSGISDEDKKLIREIEELESQLNREAKGR